VLATADVTLVTLSETGGRVSTQGKLYSQLAAGRPVIAVVPRDTDTWSIVESGGAGWCVEPSDSAGLTALIRRLVGEAACVSACGQSARRLFDAQFSLDACVGDFDTLLRELAGGPGQGLLRARALGR
jgi:glycosyltransferase involved in cell wall biosynthesis